MSLKSKKEIKSLIGWHKKTDTTQSCFYTPQSADAHCRRPSEQANGIDIYKISADGPESAENSIVKSFTSCDGNWVKEKVRNLRFEKQKIHTRRKCAVVHTFPTEEELLDDLKGYNGQWKKKQAEEAWPEHVQRTEDEKQRLAEIEQKKQQQKKREDERMKLSIQKVKQARALEEERKRRAELQRAKRAAAEEEERKKKEADEEERQRRLNERKPCGACSGSGTCVKCNGSGYHVFMYLSSKVSARCAEFRGRTAQGCEFCGGQAEYTATGKLRKGNGKCSNCEGTGKVAQTAADATGQRTSMFNLARMGLMGGGASLRPGDVKKSSREPSREPSKSSNPWDLPKSA
eukprot:gnl/MRDRNA2_/MRDRNA2_29420_c0_seq1.p1 gnl/MRDRNA2_/MRDRNA2_29420_c0~~gnl/MRDRNA2_/MRDRNA2_29420_c0_seq1.p1  ORF type:complete len:347 (+),score=91.72 gnl/MRDRNA2_/MRDRNA2_29420_c0_seq1:149-1189(+)